MRILNKWKGFTLMEVMIVVAIIGLLAAIGIPSYRKYVIKANRKAVIAQILEIQGLLEKGYVGQYTVAYVGTPDSAGGLNGDNSINVYPPSSGAHGHPPANAVRYTIDIDLNAGINPGSQTYVITAAPNPNNDQLNDICGTLSLDQTGVRLSRVGTPQEGVDPGCF